MLAKLLEDPYGGALLLISSAALLWVGHKYVEILKNLFVDLARLAISEMPGGGNTDPAARINLIALVFSGLFVLLSLFNLLPPALEHALGSESHQTSGWRLCVVFGVFFFIVLIFSVLWLKLGEYEKESIPPGHH